MGTITIYIKEVNGELYYRDNEDDHGTTITTSVDPGDKIVWRPDYCANIKSIDKLNISGDAGFFKKCPQKEYNDVWMAIVAEDATDEISYLPEVTLCDEGAKAKLAQSTASAKKMEDIEPPSLKVKG